MKWGKAAIGVVLGFLDLGLLGDDSAAGQCQSCAELGIRAVFD